jgi:ABC-type polysaccharide/polyol phosphate transport system ATPase subunit
MDVPLRSFSSGMLARLGFAIATWAQPEVLVVDEVLSVGDLSFQQRSIERIHTLMTAGTAIVFVSHSEKTMREMANQVLWLDHGRTAMVGDTDEVLDTYIAAEQARNVPQDPPRRVQ